MIFEKSHYDSRRSGKIAQVVTVMAHQGTRYTLEKQVFVQPDHAEQSWRYRLRRRTLLRPPLRRPRLANSLATSQHYRDRRFDVSKLLRIHSYHLRLRLRLLVTKRKHWTSRLPPEACMVKRIVDIFSGMKFLFYLFIFNIILTQRNNCCCTATID